jgi:hypothetical protein
MNREIIMKDFIKNNIVLVIGITLPLVMVIFLGLAAILPALFVAPPKYDLLFSTDYNSYDANGLKFNVINGKLTVNYTLNNITNNSANLYQRQSLYWYEVKTNTLKKIPINIPPVPAGQSYFSTLINVPEVSGLTIDVSRQSPDGYQFSNTGNNNIGFSDFFYNSRSPSLFLSKKGNHVAITPDNMNHFDFYNAHFIGWILPEQRK